MQSDVDNDSIHNPLRSAGSGIQQCPHCGHTDASWPKQCCPMCNGPVAFNGRPATEPRVDGLKATGVSNACSVCGSFEPSVESAFHQHLAMVVVFKHSQKKGAFCQKCLTKTFWMSTLSTMVGGWFGLSAVVGIPFVILNNVTRYVANTWQLKNPRATGALPAVVGFLLAIVALRLVLWIPGLVLLMFGI